MIFLDRINAGKKLAEVLKNYNLPSDTIILALPRWWVPLAYEISKELKIPFSLLIVRKLAPLSNPEYWFWAIAEDGTNIIDENYMKSLKVTDEELEKIIEKVLREIKERKEKYLGNREINLENKNVLIVDDGLATWFTAIAVWLYARKHWAKKVILAVPVCPAHSLNLVKTYFDDVICLYPVDVSSFAIWQYYNDFHQIDDEELYHYLNQAKQENLLI